MTSFDIAASFRRSVLLASLTLFALAAAPSAHAQSSERGEAERSEATPDATVHVKGMACQMCARSMSNALGKLASVENADVQLDEQQVLLTFERGQKATEEALRETVEGAGFSFRKVVFAGDTTRQDETSGASRKQ
jgi:copper chaperone CopZ